MILMNLENGVQSSYMQCHYAPDSFRNYTVIGSKGRLENYGDHGEQCTIEVWTNRTDSHRINGDITHRVHVAAGGHGGSDVNIVQSFINYLKGTETSSSTPQASRYSVAAGYMGALSIRAGGKPFDILSLDDEIEKYKF